MSVANTEYIAAQALLDLQSNIREIKNERYDHEESVEAAQLFLSCFITPNLAQQPIKAIASPKVETVSPMYAVAKSTTRKSDDATTHSSNMKTPDQKSKNAYLNHTYHSEESSNKRSKIFKRKPIKHFTVTSSSVPSFASRRVTNSAKKDNESKVSVTKIKSRDVATQTEAKYQIPLVDTMALTISQLCEKIISLEEQIKSKSQLVGTIDHDVSGNGNDFGDDDGESYKVNAHKLTMDDRRTPEKCNEYKNPTKVLSNRNVNADADELVPIYGNALIPSRIFRHINWNSYTSATRKLLTAVFTRRILATHSLTGKPSPAFPNKPAKKKLDPALVRDIVQTVVERCCVPENVVRTSITTKCADESKMFRTRQNNKKKRKNKINRENIPPESDSD